MTSSTFVDCWTGRSAGLVALENPTSVDADVTVCIGKTGAVAHQSAGRGELAPLIDRRYRMARRQSDELIAPVG